MRSGIWPLGRVVFLTPRACRSRVGVAWKTRASLGWQRVCRDADGQYDTRRPAVGLAAAYSASSQAQLGTFDFDAQREALWADREADRLLYYADEVIGALPVCWRRAQPNVMRSVREENLARDRRSRVGCSFNDGPAGSGRCHQTTRRAVEVGEELPRDRPAAAAIRASRLAGGAAPSCAAQVSSSAAVDMPRSARWRGKGSARIAVTPPRVGLLRTGCRLGVGGAGIRLAARRNRVWRRDRRATAAATAAARSALTRDDLGDVALVAVLSS